MPDAWMNLTDREAAALGYRIPRRAPGRRAPRRDIGDELAPVLLVGVVMLAILAFLALTSGRHAPSPAAVAAVVPPIQKSASVETTHASPTQSVPRVPRESRHAEPAAVPPAVTAAPPVFREPSRAEEPFPSPTVLALGWHCGYLVQPVYLYDAPVGRLISLLEAKTQVYYSPHATGCWREILSKEGHGLGYACLNPRDAEPGVVSMSKAPRRTEAEATSKTRRSWPNAFSGRSAP
jgi:hypothetical protein